MSGLYEDVVLLNSSNKAIYGKHAYQGNYVDEVKEYKWKI